MEKEEKSFIVKRRTKEVIRRERGSRKGEVERKYGRQKVTGRETKEGREKREA